ncbi:hypothetical protein SNE40_005374 [Patella caerulea]|uniref:Uncharacterized protein n=1 Tax=Patella caerulea TaxID=87958 RepID=A0AAN8Q4K8_PATCE
MLSRTAYNSIPKDKRPTLEYMHQSLKAANGGFMHVLGKAIFSIEIYGQVYSHTLIVAVIGSQCILGLDFLQKHDCHLDLKNKTISINGDKCATHLEGPIGICRVSLAENTVIPAGHEVLVNGYIPQKCVSKFSHKEVMLEPLERLYERKHVLPAKVVCELSDSAPWVPVRILNANDYDVFLNKHTGIGDIVPVNVIDTCDDRSKLPPKRDLPPHVLELCKRAAEGLDREQTGAVTNLLSKHQDLFAANSMELGRTDMVKHTINVGHSEPIKQRERERNGV